jgi:epoxyqueuosine reductase
VLAVRPGDGTLEARPPVAVPAPGGGCPPECRRCLDACPTGALGPDGHGAWRLDARLCLSWQGIESGLGIPAACREANGTRLFGCEACLDACPFNHPNPGPGQIPLAEALSWDEPAAFTKRFAGTSLMRAGWRQVLSNACVAAGNLADVALRERLLELCGFPDPLIAGHARWAVDRMTKNKPG